MPIVPVRDLGSLGVNTDIDPYSLPTQAFSFASNARFENKLISRGPIFKTAGVLSLNAFPRYSISYNQLAGATKYLLCNDDGTVTDWSVSGFSGVSLETNISATGWVPSLFSQPYTGAQINDVVYLNRPDRVPWFIAKSGGTQFQTLTNWDTTWRCASLRSVFGVLVAINVTKGATPNPTMVKTSDFTTFGNVPATWIGAPSNSATENVLADLKEPLVDGWPLRDHLVLYSNNETWLMEPTLDSLVFRYRRLFTNRGVLNQNCVAERNNTHYVFGPDDVWLHDGFQQKSLATDRVRNFIFKNIIRNQSYQCFVAHNPRLNEIMYCYLSSDPYCHFPVGGTYGTPGCNRAAVHNYQADTWYFYDLPYITFATPGYSVVGASWNDLADTPWTSLDNSWSTLGDSAGLTMLTVAPAASGTFGSLGASVRAFDIPNSPFSLGHIDATATASVYLENTGLDLDQVGASLRDYKSIKGLWPEARFDANSAPLMFNFGSTDYANSPLPVYGTVLSYDGNVNYKLDFKAAGRYLSIKITYSDTNNFVLGGFDVDYIITGHR